MPRRQASATFAGVDVVAVVVGLAQRRRLRVDLLLVRADAGVLRAGSAPPRRRPSSRTRSRCGPSSRSAPRRTGRSGSSPPPRAPGRPLRPGVRGAASTPGASAAQDRRDPLDRRVVAARHQPVALGQAPDAAADAAVDVVHALLGERRRPGAGRRRSTSCRRRPRGRRRESCGVRSPARRRRRPPGTISQTARGAASSADELLRPTRRRSRPRRRALATAAGSGSHTTHSCPSRISRRTMFAPIRPRPIIPSCIVTPPSRSRDAARRARARPPSHGGGRGAARR